MKRLIICAMLLVNLFVTPMYAKESVDEIPAGYMHIENVGQDDSVEVFTNGQGEYLAIADHIPSNGSLVLYDDGRDKVWLDIENDYNENSIITYGDSGWSGGSLPTGTSILTPHHFNGYITYSHQVSVTCYPPKINYAVNPSVTGALISLSNVSLSVPSNTTTGGRYAVASMTFDCLYNEDGWTGGSRSFYLTTNINSSGKTLIQWRE